MCLVGISRLRCHLLIDIIDIIMTLFSTIFWRNHTNVNVRAAVNMANVIKVINFRTIYRKKDVFHTCIEVESFLNS